MRIRRRPNKDAGCGCGCLLLVFLVWGLAKWLIDRPWAMVGALLVILAIAVYLFYRNAEMKRQRLFALSSPARMKSLTPTEFERACAVLWQRLGYRARVVGKSGDEGVDVFIWREGVQSIVQCKRYAGSSVGSPDVRNLLGAKTDFGAPDAYLMTSSHFSQPAQKLADRNPGLHLWNADTIAAKCREVAGREVRRRGFEAVVQALQTAWRETVDWCWAMDRKFDRWM